VLGLFESEHDRISNLYFNYALVTRAIAKLGPYVLGPHYTFCAGNLLQDQDTRDKVAAVTKHAASVPQIFDESVMFVNGEGPSLKEDFRNRFRNISRVMDCVGCDKCRLWGKIQTSGYGTALKILFEFHENQKPPSLKRTELVALFNTYARLSSSLSAIGKFRAMIELRDKGANEQPSTPEEIWQLVDDADEDMNEFLKMRRLGPEESIGDQVNQELDRVMMAVKIVLKSWIRTPRMM
jgi:ERO1-like protein beta